jgi:hypothetical protein
MEITSASSKPGARCSIGTKQKASGERKAKTRGVKKQGRNEQADCEGKKQPLTAAPFLHSLGRGFAWRRAFRGWAKAEGISRRRSFCPHHLPEPPPPANDPALGEHRQKLGKIAC